jgi:hypothetical protein
MHAVESFSRMRRGQELIARELQVKPSLRRGMRSREVRKGSEENIFRVSHRVRTFPPLTMNRHPHLTPAQWLPKPATRWFPDKRGALRALWSPPSEGAERENRPAVLGRLKSSLGLAATPNRSSALQDARRSNANQSSRSSDFQGWLARENNASTTCICSKVSIMSLGTASAGRSRVASTSARPRKANGTWP